MPPINPPGNNDAWKTVGVVFSLIFAAASLVVSIISLITSTHAAAEANSYADNANRLASGDRISWFTYQLHDRDPWTVRIENRSAYAAYKTLLLDQKNNRVFKVWTLPPCTRAIINFTKRHSELSKNPEEYSLQFETAGRWWKTDSSRNVLPAKNPKNTENTFARYIHQYDTRTRYGLPPIEWQTLDSCG